MNRNRLNGIIAATHTPFHPDGSLNLAGVERQAEHLLANGVGSVFIAGTTGECSSLSLEERLALTARWMEVCRGSGMKCVVHAGANCLADARQLAAQAEKLGAEGVSALPPSYFKPRSVAALVDCCADVAAAAPGLPFYYYDIPPMTGVSLPMAEFVLQARARIPNFAGLKFSNLDLMTFQQCLRAEGGIFDVAWGCDECLLAATAVGCTAAVGSTYNFAAPIYHRLLSAFARGDLAAARDEQFRSVQAVAMLSKRGFMGSAKALMKMLGVDTGPARLPNASLSPEEQKSLRSELEQAGFFDWIQK